MKTTSGNVLKNKWLPVLSAYSQLAIALSLIAIIVASLFVRRATLQKIEVDLAIMKSQQQEIVNRSKAMDETMSARLQDLEMTVWEIEPKLKKPQPRPAEPWVSNSLSDLRKRVVEIERWRMEQARKK